MEKNRLNFRTSQVAATHDIFMAALSFMVALYLRLGDNIHGSYDLLMLGTVVFTVLSAVVFSSMRLYRGVWRYASIPDLVSIIKAATVAILFFSLTMFLITRLEGMPRSVLLINWMVLIVFLGGPRLVYRVLKDRVFELDITGTPQKRKIPVLLVGADDNAELFIRDISRKRTSEYKVVGIVDNDKHSIGRKIHNVPIYGNCSQIEKVYEKLKRKGKTPQKIIISSPQAEGSEVREFLELADSLGLTLSRLPDLTDFKGHSDGELEIKPIVIEDLLGRPQATLDREAMRKLIYGKRILITGAGGTIGSELTRQIASYAPAHITLLEISEYNLYNISKELEEKYPDFSSKAIIGNIRNKDSLDLIFDVEKPQIVFHAAALKHVPMLEVEENLGQAILTNVIGTKNVADCCLTHEVEEMVFISTDKAVDPVNIMGVTKRIAESYCQALGEQQCDLKTSFTTVRFGNVLGSSGSVIPLFRRQLAEGGPITVTHPDMTRYFMTVREAVELVLQASTLGTHETHSKSTIFVLDMGEPIRIEDLALQMIRMAGLRPYTDIEITYTGVRKGEKLHEALFHESEQPLKTECDGILLARPRKMDFLSLSTKIDELHKASRGRCNITIKKIIKSLVKEYSPGLSLVYNREEKDENKSKAKSARDYATTN